MTTKVWQKTRKGNVLLKLKLVYKDDARPYSLLFQKVRTKDGRDIFLMKLCQMIYNPKTRRFRYNFDAEPTWMEPREFALFVKALMELY